MTKFTLDITDADSLAGLTAAMDAYNETLGEDDTPVDEKGYLQHVVDGACASYAKQFESEASKDSRLTQQEQEIAAKEAEIASKDAEIAVKDQRIADLEAQADTEALPKP